MPFTTPSGQTGKDAYVFEAQAIANAQRDLDARMRRLCQAIHTESPELLYSPSDYHPVLGVTADRSRQLLAYLSLTPDQYRDWLALAR